MTGKNRRPRESSVGQILDRPRGRIDLAQVYKLRVVNRLSFGEIAKALNVPKSTIHAALHRLKNLIPDPDVVKAYEEVRPTLLTAVEQRLMASLLDEQSLEKASLNNRAYAFQQVFHARRLEDGKATEQVSILSRLLEERVTNIYKPLTMRSTPLEEKIRNDNGLGLLSKHIVMWNGGRRLKL
jgi:predicted DNA-binding protein YlxM (UPF0122 family)